MKKILIALAFASGSLLSSFAGAGEVKVTWQDPDKYSDIRPSNENRDSFRAGVFKELGQVFADLGKKLPDDVQWNVTVTDLDLAGDVRPMMRPGGNDIRVIKDIYWPRMSFNYTMTDAKGQIIAQATENISDMGFMTFRPINAGNFPYETKMIEDWFQKQLKSNKFPLK
ncbi:DUF3016 domain-containing protein [Undibacterium jejuense]|uniref:DUF3016 domain-containing protein n=1 Tax=Undibacterium jejuense TaxID=1344949 RepID=A0A923HN03_9BURK|nr:DUF3016 domain-containing protein [Undibacterium jejuense]MBC3862581.1 DUF3016 domain-containing protein [Undibacterium jejuense]